MKIIITSAPDADINLSLYCAVINVADAPCRAFTCPVPHFWFPIQESGAWGYAPFYGTAKVLDFLFRSQQSPVMVHCQAGANRSPAVVYAVLSSNGSSDDAINERFPIYGGRMHEIYKTAIRKGRVHSDTIPFLRSRFEWPDLPIVGLLSAIKSPNIDLPVDA